MKSYFYIVWGYYYNSMTKSYVEKMLGCYQNKDRAEKMVKSLRSKSDDGIFYTIKEEYFCDL